MLLILAAAGEAEPHYGLFERDGVLGFCEQVPGGLLQKKLPEEVIGRNPRAVNF